MTFAVRSHEALERKDTADTYTALAELVTMVSQRSRELEEKLAEARLLHGMALDAIRKGKWHPSVEAQVAGVRKQLTQALGVA